MRYHVVSYLSAFLKDASDADILKWANEKVGSSETPLSSFKDPTLSSGR